jgi:hypothetical protein
MKPGKKEIRGQGQEKMVRMKRIQAFCAAVYSFATCAGMGEKGKRGGTITISFPLFILSLTTSEKPVFSNFFERQ